MKNTTIYNHEVADIVWEKNKYCNTLTNIYIDYTISMIFYYPDFSPMQEKKAFTLIEIILVIVMISIGVLSIIYYIQNTLNQVHEANQKVIAMNLAKEWIESVYYARNARILEHSGTDLGMYWEGKAYGDTSDRNKCRLALDSSQCPQSPAILWEGNYSIHITENELATDITFQQQDNDIDIENMLKANWQLTDANKPYAVYLSGNKWTDQSWGKTDNLTRFWRFFRKIEGKWIFLKNKDWDQKINCNAGHNNWNDNCGNNTPKEYRFCSVVKYLSPKGKKSEVKFCALITNFFPNVNQEG